jgi:hypothetical protein
MGIPRVLLGTSPFIAAGQFGERAFGYYRTFFGKPQSVADVVMKSYELGVRGVQLIPYPHVVQAIKMVARRVKDLAVVGTIGPQNPEGDVNVLNDLHAMGMLVHGALTDTHRSDRVNDLLDIIRKTGAKAGIATHRPLSTLSWALEHRLKVDLLMFPFNKLGAFMDSTPDKVLEVATRFQRVLIGKKVLACGSLMPEEALEFIARTKIDSLALGVSSTEEAKQTLSRALKLMEAKSFA